jgi:hypothetical protein
VPKYTPIMNAPVRSCYGLQSRTNRALPKALSQSSKGMYESPQMTTAFSPMVNPITKGDRTQGHGRYEKGRRNKSRS